jgi:hypothetical protein
MEKNLPLGWIADEVDAPDSWEAEFVERGACLRFRNKEIDREKFGVRPPGWPGVGITSGRDYWAIIGDSDRVIRDVWHDPDDEPSDVVGSVEEAIEAVEQDLERARLSTLLDGVVPSTVVENLIDRFETAERVLDIEADTPTLESVEGIGPARREAIQNRLMLVKMSDSGNAKSDTRSDRQEADRDE